MKRSNETDVKSQTLYTPSAHPQRLQAELEWLVQSPDLLLPPADKTLPFPITPVDSARLEQSGYQPRWRLGEHFENIVYEYLTLSPYIIDIKRNIQVREEKRTLGEFDFLLQIGQRWIHLEVALKLYLLDGNGGELNDFIGTRRDDCLALKWQRLLRHQLKLSQLPQAVARLQELGIDSQPEPALWIKGWLFYHPLSPPPARLPEPVNPDHLKGWWLTQSELELIEEPGSAYLLVRKPDWLLPVEMLETDRLSFSQLRARLEGEQRAHLVLIVRPDQSGWREVSRGFVVADDWPTRGRRSTSGH